MKFQIESPPAMEVVDVVADARGITMTPMTVRGQHVIRVCYITAVGDKGTNAKGVLLFNGNTGEFSVQRLDGDPVPFQFDKTPTDFKTARQLQRARLARKKKNEGPPSSEGLPSEDLASSEVPNATTH